MSVAGIPGYHSDAWRSLSWELGDRWADLACAWADIQPDPAGVIAALLSAVALRPEEQVASSAAFDFVCGVDWPTWQTVVGDSGAEGYLSEGLYA